MLWWTVGVWVSNDVTERWGLIGRRYSMELSLQYKVVGIRRMVNKNKDGYHKDIG